MRFGDELKPDGPLPQGAREHVLHICKDNPLHPVNLYEILTDIDYSFAFTNKAFWGKTQFDPTVKRWLTSPLIAVPPVKTLLPYCVALHELGHFFTEDQFPVRLPEVKEREVAAWNWARRNALPEVLDTESFRWAERVSIENRPTARDFLLDPQAVYAWDRNDKAARINTPTIGE